MKERFGFEPATIAAILACALSAACGGDPPNQPTPNPPVTQPPTPQPPAPPPPGPVPVLDITKILAFGDSMTEGTTSAPVTTLLFRLDAGLARSYPFKLQTLAAARYTNQTIQVMNAGHAGNEAVRDTGRFSDVIGDTKPQLVLLLEGANDLNAPFAPGEGINARIATTVSALEDMIRDAGFRGVPVMIGTLPPQRPGGPKAGAATFLSRFNDALKAMAAKKGARVVDINAQLPLTEIGQDGLHPTEAGYQHMAEIWLAAIKAAYEK